MAAASPSGASSEQYTGSLSVRDGLLQIDMQNRQLDDRGAGRWCEWALAEVPAFVRENRILRRQSDGFVTAREVNFSNNALGDRGVHVVLSMLFKLKIGVRVLKLFKNNLGRAAASALMDWLVLTPIAALELHLSHNYIPREGAVDILKAVAYNVAYPPEKNGRGKVPLWLRLEQNIVQNPEELINAAEGQMKKIRAGSVGASLTSNIPMLCYLQDPTKNECRSDFCRWMKIGGCPLAQVTYLANQRDQRTRVPPESQSWNNSRDQREETARWRIIPTVANSTASLGAAMQRPGLQPALLRQPVSNVSTASRGESGDDLGDATPSAPSREVSNVSNASQRAKEPPASRPSQWAAGPPSLQRQGSSTEIPLAAGPGVLDVGGAEPSGDRGPPSVKLPPAGLAGLVRPKMSPPAGSPSHHGLEGVDMLSRSVGPEVKAAPPGFQGEVKAAPPGFQAEFNSVARRPPPETPVPARRTPEVKGPPPGLHAPPGSVAGGARSPPGVKPPPPGFAPARKAPPSKASPASERPAADAFKAPPPGFVDVAVKAAPAHSEPSPAPVAKAPPMKSAPPGIGASASPAVGNHGLLERAMRERAHAPTAQVKNPPPMHGQSESGKASQAIGSPAVMVKGPPPKLALAKEQPPSVKPPPEKFKSPPGPLQAFGASTDNPAVPETKAIPSKEFTPPPSKHILKRPPVGSPPVQSPPVASPRAVTSPPEMPPPEAPRLSSATSPGAVDASAAPDSLPADDGVISEGMTGVSAVVARRVQQGSPPEAPADFGSHETCQDEDQEESERQEDEVLDSSTPGSLWARARNPDAPWRKCPAKAPPDSITNGSARADDPALAAEGRPPGNRPWRHAGPGPTAALESFGPPARAPPPAPVGSAPPGLVWGQFDGADTEPPSADGQLDMLGMLGSSLLQEVSTEGFTEGWRQPPNIAPPPAEPPPPIDMAAEDLVILSKPPGLPSPDKLLGPLLPDALPEDEELPEAQTSDDEEAVADLAVDEEAAEEEVVDGKQEYANVEEKEEQSENMSADNTEKEQEEKEEEEEVTVKQEDNVAMGEDDLPLEDELEDPRACEGTAEEEKERDKEEDEGEEDYEDEQERAEEEEDTDELASSAAASRALNVDAPEFVPKTTLSSGLQFLGESSDDDDMPPLQGNESREERREEEQLPEEAETAEEEQGVEPEVLMSSWPHAEEQREERAEEEAMMVKVQEAAPPVTACASASDWLNASSASDDSEDAAFAAAFEQDVSWGQHTLGAEEREVGDDASASREEARWNAWGPSQDAAASASAESATRREGHGGDTYVADAASGTTSAMAGETPELNLALDYSPKELKDVIWQQRIQIQKQRCEIQELKDRLAKKDQELSDLRIAASEIEIAA